VRYQTSVTTSAGAALLHRPAERPGRDVALREDQQHDRRDRGEHRGGHHLCTSPAPGSWLLTAAGIPGFGHSLYPAGDPRATALLDAITDLDPIAAAVARHASTNAGLLPNLDFALVALTRTLNLPVDAAFALFAIGRTAGWIAHALEQRTEPGLIRPRAHYVGVPSILGR